MGLNQLLLFVDVNLVLEPVTHSCKNKCERNRVYEHIAKP
jgi:hypothetical protein